MDYVKRLLVLGGLLSVFLPHVVAKAFCTNSQRKVVSNIYAGKVKETDTLRWTVTLSSGKGEFQIANSARKTVLSQPVVLDATKSAATWHMDLSGSEVIKTLTFNEDGERTGIWDFAAEVWQQESAATQESTLEFIVDHIDKLGQHSTFQDISCSATAPKKYAYPENGQISVNGMLEILEITAE